MMEMEDPIPFSKFYSDRGREEPAADVDTDIIRNGKDKPVCNLANVKTVLRSRKEWRDVVAFDQLATKVMLRSPVPDASGRKPNQFRPRPLTDQDVLAATDWFQRNEFPSINKETVGDGMTLIAYERGFDPLQDKLRSVVWDGVPRVENWLRTYCGAKITDTQPEAYVKAVGRCWLVSAAARALKPGCKADSALVLVGPQGIGKSTAGRILAYDWFSDALPPIHSKDAADHLRGLWIVEFGEMATASRADVEDLKSFITRTVERFRPPYGRMEIEYPRRCVFFGTSNRDQFLKDDTGNRRFWPVEVTSIGTERLKADRDQLWAEAVYAFDNGERWHLTDDEIRLATVQQAAFVVTDERADDLASKLFGRSTTSVIECIDLLGLSPDKRTQMEVAGMLRTLGWVRRSGRVKYWGAPASTTSSPEGLGGGEVGADFG